MKAILIKIRKKLTSIVMKVFPVFVSLLFTSTLYAQTLCEAESKSIFSCEIGKKSVAACLSNSGNINYLYGTKKNIELKLDSPLFSSGSCYGGGRSRLRFINKEFSYIVYDVICNGTKEIGINQWEKIDLAGLYVLEGNKMITHKRCTSFSEGIYGINSAVIPDIEKETFNYDINSLNN